MTSQPTSTTQASALDRFRLDGRVAVVAGGTGGIGLPACRAFQQVGARVAAIGVTPEKIERAREVLGDEDALVATCDVTKKADVDKAIGDVLGQFGQIDILVNSVGGGAGAALFDAHEYPEETWDWMIDLNLKSALLMSQAAARAMIEAESGGRILNISSVRGQLALRLGYSAYVAAKGALNMLTKQHATEWAPYGITVNALSPTFVRTPQVESLLADEEFKQALIARIPLGRIAEPDDLIGAILFFCSDASAFITGQILTADGGLTACQ